MKSLCRGLCVRRFRITGSRRFDRIVHLVDTLGAVILFFTFLGLSDKRVWSLLSIIGTLVARLSGLFVCVPSQQHLPLTHLLLSAIDYGLA